MAQERKAGDSGPSSVKMRSAVPPAKKDDIEDVAWALQTAEATWSRGEHADALKWIRRAAEAASEAEKDDRALELAKAAADVASLLADRPAAAAPPPPPSAAPPAARTKPSSKPPPAMSPGAQRLPMGAPTPPKVGANMPPLPRPGQKAPIPARVQAPAPVSRRGGRRSSPSFADEAAVTSLGTVTGEVPRLRKASTTNETKRRGRLSKPATDEIVQVGPVTARQPSTEEIEAWPTQTSGGAPSASASSAGASSAGEEEDDDEALHTRIGTPAYHEGAQRASARPAAMPRTLAPLVMSQAVRVVVWRSADGVHVAPAGTQVAAIGVEAVLVALDPVADLAAWLSNR